jgi:hypothetical protein
VAAGCSGHPRAVLVPAGRGGAPDWRPAAAGPAAAGGGGAGAAPAEGAGGAVPVPVPARSGRGGRVPVRGAGLVGEGVRGALPAAGDPDAAGVSWAPDAWARGPGMWVP